MANSGARGGDVLFPQSEGMRRWVLLSGYAMGAVVVASALLLRLRGFLRLPTDLGRVSDHWLAEQARERDDLEW